MSISHTCPNIGPGKSIISHFHFYYRLVTQAPSVLLWPGTTKTCYPRYEITELGFSSLTQRRLGHAYVDISGGQIQLSPEIEKSKDWKFLQPHLAAEKWLAEDYAKWLLSLGELFSMCHNLLLHLKSEIDKRINEMMQLTPGWEGVKMVSGWGKRGVCRWFYEDIYTLVLGQGESDEEEFGQKPVGGHPQLVGLFRLNKELTRGTTHEIDTYQKVHKSIRDKAAHWKRIRDLLEMHKNCKDKAEDILFKLNVIEKRGDFNGVCDICRPWHDMQIRT